MRIVVQNCWGTPEILVIRTSPQRTGKLHREAWRREEIAIIAGIAKIEKPTPTPLKHGVSGGMKIARYRAESHVSARDRKGNTYHGGHGGAEKSTSFTIRLPRFAQSLRVGSATTSKFGRMEKRRQECLRHTSDCVALVTIPLFSAQRMGVDVLLVPDRIICWREPVCRRLRRLTRL